MVLYWKKDCFDNLDPENPINFDLDFSDADTTYNCIGWAIDPENPKNWWPGKKPNYQWPKTLSEKKPTLDNFKKAFAIKGYLPCDDGSLEPGIEKVALYAITDDLGRLVIKHASRQLDSGKWTSKLGESVDIKHFTPEDVNGPLYGERVQFLGRKRRPS